MDKRDFVVSFNANKYSICLLPEKQTKYNPQLKNTVNTENSSKYIYVDFNFHNTELFIKMYYGVQTGRPSQIRVVSPLSDFAVFLPAAILTSGVFLLATIYRHVLRALRFQRSHMRHMNIELISLMSSSTFSTVKVNPLALEATISTYLLTNVFPNTHHGTPYLKGTRRFRNTKEFYPAVYQLW